MRTPSDAFRNIRRVHVSFLQRTKGQNTLYAPAPLPPLFMPIYIA